MGFATIEVRGIKAFLRNAVWRCADPALLAEIEERSATYLPDVENARVVANELGGIVTSVREKDGGEIEPETIH